MRKIRFRVIIDETTTIPFILQDLVDPDPIFSIRELVIPWLKAGKSLTGT